MPVPVWDCTDMSLLDEPLDTVLSDDIWKKFDLDEPLEAQYVYGHNNSVGLTSSSAVNGHGGTINEKTIMTMTMSSIGNNNSNIATYDESIATPQAVSLTEFYDKLSCRESREIRHHDCMWAGLCISKEHNRTLPAKNDGIVSGKKVPAGRSLLISSRATTNVTSNQQESYHQQQIKQQQHQQQQQQQQQQHHHHHQKQTLYQHIQSKDGLDSDGDSARPETPQSSESESESEDDDNYENEENDEDEDDEIETKISTRRRTISHQQQQQQHQQQQQKQIQQQQQQKQQTEQQQQPQHRIKQEIVDGPKQQQPQHLIKQEIVNGPLVFRHDQISINEKLSECMSNETSNVISAPVSEVTGQYLKKQHHNLQTDVRIKIENEHVHKIHRNNNFTTNEIQQQSIVIKNEPDSWNTLSDHCYHQPSSKKLEHLGVQTPSDSEEEIDVVTFEKPCRPAALPTYPSIADQQHFQLTVKSALKEKPATAPRPRGRPPLNGAPRKRSAPNDTKPSKRPKQHRSYQSRSKVTKNSPPTPATTPIKDPLSITTLQPETSRSSTSDDEPDTEKRSLHNNMERQRRIELRNAFEDLRLLVPEIEDKEKAPKVAILRQAAIYCDMLTEIGQVTTARVTEMKRRQERLRTRLSQLRRNLAMNR